MSDELLNLDSGLLKNEELLDVELHLLRKAGDEPADELSDKDESEGESESL
jgi:hypothetical protein